MDYPCPEKRSPIERASLFASPPPTTHLPTHHSGACSAAATTQWVVGIADPTTFDDDSVCVGFKTKVSVSMVRKESLVHVWRDFSIICQIFRDRYRGWIQQSRPSGNTERTDEHDVQTKGGERRSYQQRPRQLRCLCQ